MPDGQHDHEQYANGLAELGAQYAAMGNALAAEKAVNAAQQAQIDKLMEGGTGTPPPPPPPDPGTRVPTIWDPWASNSPWKALASTYTLESPNGPMTTAMRRDPNGAADPQWTTGINWDRYSCPIYIATAADPLVPIVDSSHGVTLKANIPAAATPAVGSDANFIVVQLNGDVVDAYGVKWTTPGQTLSAARVGRTNINGVGFGPLAKVTDATNKQVQLAVGCRSSANSWMAGMIRPHHVDPAHPFYVGGINCAVAIALPGSRYLYSGGNHGYDVNGWGTSLGYDRRFAADQDWNANSVYKGPIPMGRKFIIPSSVDINTLGLTPQVLEIAKAAQKYGVIPVDKTDDYDAWAMFYATPDIANTPGGKAWINGCAGSSLMKLRRALVATV